MTLRVVKLAAVLLPAALLLHEGAYALGGGGLPFGFARRPPPAAA